LKAPYAHYHERVIYPVVMELRKSALVLALPSFLPGAGGDEIIHGCFNFPHGLAFSD